MIVTEYTPRFTDEKVLYTREEKNGFHTLVNKNPNAPDHFKIINFTTKQIIGFCNGDNTIDKIINEMSKIYPQAPLDVLSNDVVNVIYLLEQAGFIEMKNGCSLLFDSRPKVILEDKSLQLYRAKPSDSKDIFEFLEKALKNDSFLFNCFNKFVSTSVPVLYNEPRIRESIKYNIEPFYILKHEMSCVGIVSILYSTSYITKAEVQLLVVDDQNNLLDSRLKFLISGILQSISTKPLVFKINLIENIPFSSQFKEILESLYFSKDGDMGIDNNTISFYSKFYGSEQ